MNLDGAATDLVGEGTSAVVWALPGERVAKVFRRRSPATELRALHEAAMMKRIGAPPMATLLEHTTTDDGRAVLVMERLRGRTLATVLADAPAPFAPDRALAIFARIAERVASLHRAGVVHCDLKPANLMLCTDGDVRLLDAGLAVTIDAASHAVQPGGTLDYVSPEVLRCGRVDARADVYALGAILFELLALRPPFVGDAAAVRHGHELLWPPRLNELVPCPDRLADLVDRCLAKDPARRPDDAGVLARALPSAAGRTAITTPARVRKLQAGSARVTVLIAIESELSWAHIERALEPHGGLLARRTAAASVAVFDGDRGAPLDRAVRAAHELVAAGARRVVVHTAPVRMRPGSRVVAIGAALDEVAAWLPAHPTGGVVMSAAASAACPPRREADVPLVGRTDELSTMRRAMLDALDGTAPVPTAIVGPAASGRSRMLREAAELARGVRARVVLLETPSDRRGELAIALGIEAADLLTLMAAVGTIARREQLVILVDDVTPIDRELVAVLAKAATANPIWLCLAGEPAAIAAQSVGGGVVIPIGPVGGEDAAQLAQAMLPSCPLSMPLRHRLATWAGGLPGALAELPEMLRAIGAMRAVPGSALWEIDPTGLEKLSPTAARQWLAERQSDALVPPLATLARVCAVLGDEIDEAEVIAVCRELVADGVPASTFADPGTAWRELLRHGVLVAHRGRLGFRGEASRAAFEAGLDDDARRRIHAAALNVARRSSSPARLHRIARHATGAEARAAQVALARDAEQHHAHLLAELHLGLALDLAAAADDDGERMTLSLRRGRARRLSTRYEAALEDVATALALAAARGDLAGQAEALLHEAAILDQTERFDDAATLIARAEALVGDAALPPALQAFLDNRRGVVARRQGRLDASAAFLAAAARAADADADVRRGSALLLSRVLAVLGRRDEGIAILDATLAECEADGDYFHLVSGLLNRVTFWSEAGRIQRARADAERGRGIARDMGLVQLAIWIDHNLSIASWWNGDLGGAVLAARRAHELGVQRFRDHPNVTGTTQLAIYLVAAGQLDEAGPLLERLRRHAGGGAAHARNVFVLDLACGAVDQSWDTILAEMDHPQERVETLWLRAHREERRGDRQAARGALEEAIAIAGRHGAGLHAILEREYAALA
ncbi:MAG TPA: protein kinase [Kofleriaceae bacterium]|nr:protein kinase [Kofleriaceae bacterium]